MSPAFSNGCRLQWELQINKTTVKLVETIINRILRHKNMYTLFRKICTDFLVLLGNLEELETTRKKCDQADKYWIYVWQCFWKISHHKTLRKLGSCGAHRTRDMAGRGVIWQQSSCSCSVYLCDFSAKLVNLEVTNSAEKIKLHRVIKQETASGEDYQRSLRLGSDV